MDLIGIAGFAMLLLLEYRAGQWFGINRRNVQLYALLVTGVGVSLVVRQALDSAHAGSWPGGAGLFGAVAVLGVFVLTGIEGTSSVLVLPAAIAVDAASILTRWRTTIIVACAFGALVAALLILEANPRRAYQTEREFAEWYARQPREVSLMPAAGDPAVLLVKFIDYQCPACLASEAEYESVVSGFRSRGRAVKVVRRDFPLESECNPGVRDLHRVACEAAAAVRLAERVDRGDAMSGWLFDNQAKLTSESIWAAARSITGLADVRSYYDDALREVNEDVRLGKALRVTSTPTYFLNGVRLGRVPASFLERALESESSRKR